MRCLLGLLGLCLAALPARAQDEKFQLDGYAPAEGLFWVEGVQARFRHLGDPALRLKVVYRPNSKVARGVQVARGAEGWVTFVPEAPGLLRLAAYEVVGVDDKGEEKHKELDKKVVSVRFAGAGLLGISIMVLAGILLFGGAFVSIRALLRAQPRSHL